MSRIEREKKIIGVMVDIYCKKKHKHKDGTYTNILVSRTDDVDSEKIQVLKKVLTSEKSKKFLEENYKGVIVPVFQKSGKPRILCEVFLFIFNFPVIIFYKVYFSVKILII